jgi:hypothetical protein
MYIGDLHRLLGHAGEAKTREAGKNLKIDLIGNMKVCEFCDVSKARKKKISKENTKKTIVPGERVYIDITPIRAVSAGDKKNWLLIVDEATDMKWSHFMATKNELSVVMMNFVREMKSKGTPLRFIRLDNAGENKGFRDKARKNGYGDIRFEYTAPGTPKQNGVVERAFPTLLGRVRSMMNQAGFTKEMRANMWAECARTATMLENSMPDCVGEQPPIVKFTGDQYNWVYSLRTFGEMAVLLDNATANQDKLTDRGRVCMFVGYSDEHPRHTYRFVNLHTNRIVLSRDVKWLNKMWGEYQKIKQENVINIDHDDGYELEEQAFTEDPGDQIIDQGGNQVIGGAEATRGSRVERELMRLSTFYNPTVPLTSDEEAAEIALMSAVESGYDEPRNFKEAWNHEDQGIRGKWQHAIRK